MDHPQERLLQLLVPGRHPAELLELGEQPLDPVPLAGRPPRPAARGRPGCASPGSPPRPRSPRRPAAAPPRRTPCRRPPGRPRPAGRRSASASASTAGLVRLPGPHVHRDRGVLVGRRHDDLAGQPAAAAGPAPCRAESRPGCFSLTPRRRAGGRGRWSSRRAPAGPRRTPGRRSSARTAGPGRRRRPSGGTGCRRRPRRRTRRAGRGGDAGAGDVQIASKNIRSGSTGGWPPLWRLALLTSGSIAAQSPSVIMYRMAFVLS